ncbi:MAG TPA: hypothetical protein ENI08_00420 [Candidatus Dependentiae bacterium]|nr:hypothetical protein [Candidatus Dependentiae bacterium]
MKKTLITKILFTSLLFSATVSSTMQANLDFTALGNKLVEFFNQTANWLTTNGGIALNFLKKQSIAVKGAEVVATIAVTNFALNKWKSSKVVRQRNHRLLQAAENGNLDEVKLLVLSDICFKRYLY